MDQNNGSEEVTAPVVAVARQVAEEKENGNERRTLLSDGRWGRLVPVSIALVEEVTARIVDPPVPMWHNEERDRDEPNPSDPTYLAGLAEAEKRRGMAVMDAMIMFGVDLLEGLPEGDGWVDKLRFMERLGALDLSKFDTDNPIDREFLYKRYIACPASLVGEISRISGMTEADVEKAERTFQGDKAR